MKGWINWLPCVLGQTLVNKHQRKPYILAVKQTVQTARLEWTGVYTLKLTTNKCTKKDSKSKQKLNNVIKKCLTQQNWNKKEKIVYYSIK